MDAIYAIYLTLFLLVLMFVYAMGEAFVSLIIFSISTLFIGVTKGSDRAKEHWNKSWRVVTGQPQVVEEAIAGQEESRGPTPSQGQLSPKQVNQWGCTCFGLLIVVLYVVSYAVIYSMRLDDCRRGQARSLVRDRVRQIEATWDDQQPHLNPKSGMLDERDPWGHRLELSVDESLLGVKLTVRSVGSDGKPGTIDDVCGVSFKQAQAGEIGRELGDRAADKAKQEWGDFKARFGAKADEIRQKLGEVGREEPADEAE